MKLLIHFAIWVLLGSVSSQRTTTPFPPGSSKCQDEVSRPDEHCDDRTIRKSFICRYCGGDFEKRSVLTTHVRKIHPNEQPYWCKICSKGFSGTTNWKSHERTHTGEKPYSCELCSKKFNAKSNLRAHMRRHREGETFFACAICGTHLKTKSSLTTHMMHHETPFSCDLCHQRFRKESELSNHLWIHAEEKEHSCGVCSEKFKFKDSLTSHMRCHLNAMPFACKNCGRRFKFSKSLEKHMNVHQQTDNADGLPSYAENNEQSDTRSFLEHSGAHVSQELDQGDGPATSSHSEILSHTSGTSSNPRWECTCYGDSRIVQENHQCIFEQPSEQHQQATTSNVDTWNGIDPLYTEIPDGPTWMEFCSIYGVSSYGYEGGTSQDNNYVDEEFVRTDPGLLTATSHSGVSSTSEGPHRFFRAGLESRHLYSCNIEGDPVSVEVERVISQIVRLQQETQRPHSVEDYYERDEFGQSSGRRAA